MQSCNISLTYTTAHAYWFVLTLLVDLSICGCSIYNTNVSYLQLSTVRLHFWVSCGNNLRSSIHVEVTLNLNQKKFGKSKSWKFDTTKTW